MITDALIAATMPASTRAQRVLYGPHLQEVCARYQINTPRRIAHFLAQIGVESGWLRRVEENLTYSAVRLTQVWPRRFPTIEIATPYAGHPERLANLVYADRMGNGPPASGDGYRFRGRGLKQLTGRRNYEACGAALGVPLVTQPDLLTTPKLAALSAGWFWDANRINRLADIDDVGAVTRVVNGGTNGLDERQEAYRRAIQHLTEVA